MTGTDERKTRELSGLALLLALIGGCVDAVGFMALFHMYTAHMSGNSISTGIHVAQARYPEAFHRIFPIPLYVLGVALGAGFGEALARRGVHRTFAAALGLEAVLLGAFLAWGTPLVSGGEIRPASPVVFYLLAALPALAMGVQNSTLRRVGKSATVRTTYITGMLTNLAEEAVLYLYWLYDHAGRVRRRPWAALRVSLRQPPFRNMTLQLGIWVLYVGGAILGALGKLHWDLRVLLAPVALLALICLRDLVWPLVPSPHEQKKVAWHP